MIFLGSNKGEGRDNDEQWITVQDKNNALDQKSVATKQHCVHCLVLGFSSVLSMVLLGNS